MRRTRLALLMGIAACGKSPTPPASIEPRYYNDDLPPAEDLLDLDPLLDGLDERLMATFIDDGQVVARVGGDNASALAKDQGDSKFFSGLAVASLPCDLGKPILDRIVRSIVDHDGAVVRFDPLPQSFTDSNNEASLDTITGVTFGFSERALRCPADIPEMKAAWDLHRAFVASHGQRIAEHTAVTADTPGFVWIWNLTGWILGSNPKPKDKEVAELAVMGTVEEVKVKRSACFPVHLAMLDVIEAAHHGEPMSKLARWTICQSMSGMQIPMADWLCERATARMFLQGFVTDVWSYRNQRCGAWETPDGNGDGQPGLDALVMNALARRI